MFDSSRFNFDKDSKIITSELSMFRDRPVFRHLDGNFWGLGIINRRTKNATEWFITGKHYSDDGEDIQCYDLEPTSKTLRKFPHLSGWKLHIFND